MDILFLISVIFTGFTHFLNEQYKLDIRGYFARNLLTGLLAGLIGGLLYAYLIEEVENFNAFCSAVFRVSFSSGIIGGFYGLVLGIFQPSKNFIWRQRFSICFTLSLVIILAITCLAIITGDKWPTSEKNYADCYFILIIIGIYSLIIAWRGILDHNDDYAKKQVRKYLVFLMVYLCISAGVVFGLVSWISGGNLFLFEFRPEKIPPGISISLFMFLWSGSGYLLVTHENRFRNKLDSFLH